MTSFPKVSTLFTYFTTKDWMLFDGHGSVIYCVKLIEGSYRSTTRMCICHFFSVVIPHICHNHAANIAKPKNHFQWGRAFDNTTETPPISNIYTLQFTLLCLVTHEYQYCLNNYNLHICLK